MVNMFTIEIDDDASILSGIEVATHEIIGGIRIPAVIAGNRWEPRRRTVIAVHAEDPVPVMYTGRILYTQTERPIIDTHGGPQDVILHIRAYPGDGDARIYCRDSECIAEGSGHDDRDRFYREWVVSASWEALNETPIRIERGSIALSWAIKAVGDRVVVLPAGEEDLI